MNYDVFMNCPFDDQFKPIFNAIVFTIFDCGFVPRCSLEVSDGGIVRIEKINNIIAECTYGIHDISRTELDAVNQLPRFNMPLELGLFLGAKRFGGKKHKKKMCLILDREPYRYQKFISDISGQDISSHEDNPEKATLLVANWLRGNHREVQMPGGIEIWRRYQVFTAELPVMCQNMKLSPTEIHFNDYFVFVETWLSMNSAF